VRAGRGGSEKAIEDTRVKEKEGRDTNGGRGGERERGGGGAIIPPSATTSGACCPTNERARARARAHVLTKQHI